MYIYVTRYICCHREFWSCFCFLYLCLRFCGTTFPPDLTSSSPHMTVVFVADEGVADSGFNATYQAVSVLGSEFLIKKKSNSYLTKQLCDVFFFSYFLLCFTSCLLCFSPYHFLHILPLLDHLSSPYLLLIIWLTFSLPKTGALLNSLKREKEILSCCSISFTPPVFVSVWI